MNEQYQVFVSKDYFKFNAAHFMAYPGFRERLHGHNYRVAVRIEGELGSDGYVIDFGDIKRAARVICDEINERVIVPRFSDCLKLVESDVSITLECEDGSVFCFPRADCVILPIAHSSAEELAAYVCKRLLTGLEVLDSRVVGSIEVSVAEAPLQEARYRVDL